MKKRYLYAILVIYIILFVPLIVAPVVVTLKETSTVLNEGKLELKKSFTSFKKMDLNGAKEHLRSANRDFDLGIRKMDTFQISIAQYIPLMGRQIKAIRNLSESAKELSSAGLEAMKASDKFFNSENELNLSLSNGLMDIGKVKKSMEHLKNAKKHLLIAESMERNVPKKFVMKSISDSDKKYAKELKRFKEAISIAHKLAKFLPSFLGEDNDRKYFLAMQNNAELRGTGGLIGNYGILKIQDGEFSLDEFEEIHVLRKRFKIPARTPRDFRRRYGVFESDKFWLNVNMSPDFPTVSRVLIDLFYKAKQEKVDGVIAIDPIGLSYLLDSIGPVTVDSKLINSGNVVEWTLNKSYFTYQVREQRKEFLSDVSEAVWEKVVSSQVSSPDKLFANIGRALNEKHMMIYSSYPVEERNIRSLGYSGGFNYDSDDYSLLVLNNLGENKMDYYLKKEIDCKVVVGKDGSAVTEMKVNLFNNGPRAAGMPTYVAGIAKDRYGWNVAHVNIYGPLGRKIIEYTIDGQKTEEDYEDSTEMGKSVFSVGLNILPQERKQIILKFKSNKLVDLKKKRFSANMQIQPTVTAARMRYEVVFPQKFKIKNYDLNASGVIESNNNVFKFDGILDTDKYLQLFFK